MGDVQTGARVCGGSLDAGCSVKAIELEQCKERCRRRDNRSAEEEMEQMAPPIRSDCAHSSRADAT